METKQNPPAIHPVFMAAAIAVILACLSWIASLAGLFSHSGKSTAPEPVIINPSTATSAIAVTPVIAAAASVAAITEKAEAAKPTPPEVPLVKKPVPKKITPRHQPAQKQQNYPSTNYAQAPARLPGPVASVTHPAPSAPPICQDCGIVESVQAIEQPGQASGLGAVTGALLGGVLGHQVGGGNGQKLATLAGVIGGGMAGNAVEKNTGASTNYEVIVRMENGNRQRFILPVQRWRSGDRIRVSNGSLVPRD